MSTLDLHIHSRMSDDGELTPQELVALGRANGLALMAITDHNTVRGVGEALAAAGDGLRVISGVELDCQYGGRGFHLLGYGIDHTRPAFAAIERDILEQERTAAAQKIALFVKATGIPVDSDALLGASANGTVTGEQIAEQLLERPDAASYPLLRPYLPGGERSDMPHVRFYWDFFAQGCVAFVPIRYLSLRDAVTLVRDAGGVPVLAHPGQNLKDAEDLLPGILAEGVAGIEAFSSYHSRAQAERYLAAAEQHKLLVTCGSDFHGKHKPNIRLGGHGAFWPDELLLAGVTAHLGQA